MAFKLETIGNENEGAKLLRSEILEIMDENVYASGTDPVADSLGFVVENVEIRDGKFTSMLGAQGLEEIGEMDEFPLANKEQGYEKGYKLARYARRVGASKPLTKWIMASQSSAKFDATVKTEIARLGSDVRELTEGVKITKNEIVTEVLTKGFSVTAAYGPGSAHGDGQALFSAAHVIKSTGATQSNLQAGVLSQVTLLATLEKLRNMKNGRGRYMKRAMTYTLVVSLRQEELARKILNNGSNFAAAVDGVATSNDVTLSVFQFEGFRVELMVLETLGQPKTDGTIVGTDTMWFVINKEAARSRRSFKYINLYNEEMDMWYDSNTKISYVDVDLSFTADAFDYEVIVGSTGV